MDTVTLRDLYCLRVPNLLFLSILGDLGNIFCRSESFSRIKCAKKGAKGIFTASACFGFSEFFGVQCAIQFGQKFWLCTLHSNPQLFLECGLVHSKQHPTPQFGLELLIGVLHSTPHSNPSSPPHSNPIFTPKFDPNKMATLHVECGLEWQRGLLVGVLDSKYALPLGTPTCGVQYCGVPFCTPS